MSSPTPEACLAGARSSPPHPQPSAKSEALLDKALTIDGDNREALAANADWRFDNCQWVEAAELLARVNSRAPLRRQDQRPLLDADPYWTVVVQQESDPLVHARPWWLAAPGPLRRFEMTALVLAVLAGLGLLAGFGAWALGAGNRAWMFGVFAAAAAEGIGFAIPVRITAERRFSVPATPEEIFAIGADPTQHRLFNPTNLTVGDVSGTPGTVGFTYTASSSGLRMRTSVVDSEPPHRIVTETKSRLSRLTALRTYTPDGAGTEVKVRTIQRIPLAAWLLQPVFRGEVAFVLSETQRRLGAHFSDAAPASGDDVLHDG